MAAVRWGVAGVVLAAGCGVPDGGAQLVLSVTPGDQALRDEPALVGRYDPGTAELAVRHADQEVARGPTAAGEVLRFAAAGRRYELAFAGVQAETECEDRTRSKTANHRDVKCREYTSLPARLTSPDGPLPGSTPTLRGAQSRRFLVTALPGLLAGALAGRAAFASIGVGILLVLATIAGGCAIGWYGFDGAFAVTYALAFLVYAAAGLFAAISWRENSRSAAISLALGPALGAAAVVAAMPLWSEGSPLVAVAAGVVGVIVVAMIEVAVTAALGDAHPASRWLLGAGGAPGASGVEPRERRPRRRKQRAAKD
jgi:hypothetical protein